MPEIKLDNIEAGILADFLRSQSRAGNDVKIEIEEGTGSIFFESSSASCEVTDEGTVFTS